MAKKQPTRDEILTLLRKLFAENLPQIKLASDETPLFGRDAQLNSMDLVTFVADAEEAVNERFGATLILADERALSRSKSPFRSLAALAEYIEERLSHA